MKVLVHDGQEWACKCLFARGMSVAEVLYPGYHGPPVTAQQTGHDRLH
jgi:hypothetical protein